MKKIITITLFAFICATSYSQIFQFSSNDVLKSKRDKSTGQTIYSKKIIGSVILRFDESRKMAVFYSTHDQITSTYTNLTIQEQQGIKLAVGYTENRKVTIMISDVDKTASVIYTLGNIQEGYVMKNYNKKTISGLFDDKIVGSDIEKISELSEATQIPKAINSQTDNHETHDYNKTLKTYSEYDEYLTPSQLEAGLKDSVLLEKYREEARIHHQYKVLPFKLILIAIFTLIFIVLVVILFRTQR